MTTLGARGAFAKIGEGVHSEVFQRPGSQYVVQVFKPDCAELTAAKLRHEYAYLRVVYASLPRLVPWQRLLLPRPGATIQEAALVKDYVPHRPDLALHRVDPAHLASSTRQQIRQFLWITRGLLADTRPHPQHGGEASMLPDVIDPPFANLVINTRTGDLTLIDTNRLISTRKLAQRATAGLRIDLAQHRIHTLLLRRLMYLESKYLGRSHSDLSRDPIYSRYLEPADFDTIVAASATAGEPIG